MPGRRFPPEILAHLGPCRQPVGLVETVIEQCALAKLGVADQPLTDFDPLVVVLRLVAAEFVGMGHSLDRPAVRKAWCEVVGRIQRGEAYLEHNAFIPCRSCDTAFEPVVDEALLALFLAWNSSRRAEDLVAIHRCPACGGGIAAKRCKRYDGDMHTPEPGTVEDDLGWAETLLQHARF